MSACSERWLHTSDSMKKKRIEGTCATTDLCRGNRCDIYFDRVCLHQIALDAKAGELRVLTQSGSTFISMSAMCGTTVAEQLFIESVLCADVSAWQPLPRAPYLLFCSINPILAALNYVPTSEIFSHSSLRVDNLATHTTPTRHTQQTISAIIYRAQEEDEK